MEVVVMFAARSLFLCGMLSLGRLFEIVTQTGTMFALVSVAIFFAAALAVALVARAA